MVPPLRVGPLRLLRGPAPRRLLLASRARALAALQRSTPPAGTSPAGRKYYSSSSELSNAAVAQEAGLSLDPDRVGSGGRACGGCGVALQSHDTELPGYVPAERERVAGRIVCQRCWRLQHHRTHAAYAHQRPRLHRPELLRGLSQRRGLVVCVVDLLDGQAGLPPELPQLLGPQSRLILVGTKLDLLPRDAPLPRLKHWLRSRALERGVRDEQLAGVQLTGCPARQGLTALAQLLERELAGLGQRPAEAFVIGGANAGKSTLLNALAPLLKGPAPALTTSALPGTTLDLVAVPLPHGATLWDTPGLVRAEHLWGLLHPNEADLVLPRSPIRPVAYRLQAGKSLFVGGLARLDVLRCSAPFIVVSAFVSAHMRRHLHPTAQDRAPQLLERQLGGLLQPPLSQPPRTDWPPLERHLMQLHGRGGRHLSHDLSLHGAGWLSVAAPAEALLALHLLRGLPPLHCADPLLPFALDSPRLHIRKHGRVAPATALEHIRTTRRAKQVHQ